MTMPQPVSTGLAPQTLARLAEELETARLAHAERIADTPDHPDDISVAMYNRSVEAHEQVVAALERMEDGTYGICQNCQGPISDARLEAMPHAALCMACAR